MLRGYEDSLHRATELIARVLAALAFAIVTGGVALTLIWFGQRRMIYFPDRTSPSLNRSGLTGAEEVMFESADGLRLGAWFVAGTGSRPRVTVIVFPGNAGHRGYRASLADALCREGMNVLLTDYRGYGGNPGAPSEEGLAADARAARQYVLSRSDVDAARLVYFGESLGAAVAIRLASERPPSALILRSPFASLALIGQHHYPILPVRLLLRDRYPSIELARGIRAPTLIIAGTRDSIVPMEHSRMLYEALGGPKSFVEVAADHNDEALLDGEQMIQAIARFLGQP